MIITIFQGNLIRIITKMTKNEKLNLSVEEIKNRQEDKNVK